MTEQDKFYADLLKADPSILKYPYDAIAECIGIDAFIKMSVEFKGTVITIPSLRFLTKDRRNELIRDDFYKNGLRYNQLVNKYGMNDATLRKIIKR